ncbi:hypothetical protein QR685DRAFT_572299 [Neurospora intermedia]|uniref:Uncharacterized protein n=1 Tax=Neurospora intermedia TaxID=5142 RepID=A0ABR3D9B1_NEUIN
MYRNMVLVLSVHYKVSPAKSSLATFGVSNHSDVGYRPSPSVPVSIVRLVLLGPGQEHPQTPALPGSEDNVNEPQKIIDLPQLRE